MFPASVAPPDGRKISFSRFQLLTWRRGGWAVVVTVVFANSWLNSLPSDLRRFPRQMIRGRSSSVPEPLLILTGVSFLDRSPSVFENPIGNYPSRDFPAEKFEIGSIGKERQTMPTSRCELGDFHPRHVQANVDDQHHTISSRCTQPRIDTRQQQIHPQIQRLEKINHRPDVSFQHSVAAPPPFSFRDVGCLPIPILHALAKHQPPSEGLVVVKRNTSHPAILWKS
ncbi:hypothetical protein B0T18DRAFT_188152 [Schizothecium vesticola]|uniref:Uncharacterized protein n=1 Tax=Schizothecium vesticola TaxID=314040 RepID=A0AA40EQJ1_9PEZI|nr:hypothetical protein B0T18DRAFT_188152 [Schizothecium vesticola]